MTFPSSLKRLNEGLEGALADVIRSLTAVYTCVLRSGSDRLAHWSALGALIPPYVIYPTLSPSGCPDAQASIR